MIPTKDREPHWIKHNQQERMPTRMVAFDTEARRQRRKTDEIQDWRMGCAIRWRTDLKTGDHAEGRVFSNPYDLWIWISEFTKAGCRTVVWCHNLGYDSRISQVFTILPKMGFRLEWCNLDRNVSSMTWRSDHGTIVFADTWTWLPMALESIAPQVGLIKYDMPKDSASDPDWQRYCMRDAEIVYHVVSRLCGYITSNGLGNWQPTGAGMAMATWRHRFLDYKILVHDDTAALEAERSAMYTGRAEAWRHGKLGIGTWTEVDLRNAYLTIASECSLPRKLHMSTGSITRTQYDKLRERFNLLCYVDVSTEIPVLPYRDQNHTLWPVGKFSGWYWDNEIDCARRYGANIKVRRSYVYVSDPVLKRWADWVMHVLRKEDDTTDPVVKTWIKHCSRALIGRIALRTPSWEPWGSNPEGITGITHVTFPEDGTTTRLLHVGDETLIETHRTEGRDSLPQITGYIMAECRVRIWEGMNAAGTQNLAHVDTDSVLVNRAGVDNLRASYDTRFDDMWSLKGSYRRLEIYGPRAYRRDGARVAAGIPRGAKEGKDGVIRGERWTSLSVDLGAAQGQVVTIVPGQWRMKRTDPRRRDATGAGTATMAYSVGDSSEMSSSLMPSPGDGS
jgi:hypothetical protein